MKFTLLSRMGLLCGFLIWSFHAFAAAPPPLGPCHAELKSGCASAVGDSAQLKCLFENRAALGSECHEALERWIQSRGQAETRGGGALTSFGGLNALGSPLPLLAVEGKFIPGQNGGMRQTDSRMDLSAPVYHDEKAVLSMSLAGAEIDFGRAPVLDTGRTLSENLTRVEVGAMYARKTSERHGWSVRASAGYAGDSPSYFASDASYSLSVTYAFPNSERSSWLLMAFLSNNSVLVNYVPIPGFIYFLRTEHLNAMLGFPVLGIEWTPEPMWSYALGLFGITVNAEVAYGHRDNVQGYFGYANQRQSFIPHERDTTTDRLIVREQRFGPGLRFAWIKNLLLEAQAGWTFGRAVYLGSILQIKDGSETFGDDAFLDLKLKYLF